MDANGDADRWYSRAVRGASCKLLGDLDVDRAGEDDFELDRLCRCANSTAGDAVGGGVVDAVTVAVE